MTKRQSRYPAKITCPRLTPAVYPRKRLFRLLDKARERPAVFLSAAPGSGKTTLILSYLEARDIPCCWYQCDSGDADIQTFFYFLGRMAAKAAPRKRPLPVLTPEYLPNLAVFAGRYFRNFFSRLKSPQLVVFDNYQEIGEQSLVHEVMRQMLAEIPEGITVVIISRHDVPPAFARMRANRELSIVDDPLLRLTGDETRGIINRRGRKMRLQDQTMASLHELSGGWVAGLTLLLEGGIDPGGMRKGMAPKEVVFAYFAGEIFDTLDKASGDFLLKTSLLSLFTLDMAKKLTGNAGAGSILSSLLRNNYFITKQPGPRVAYQYHQLFREFLSGRARKDFSSQQMGLLLRHSAELLEQAGRSEEAVHLLETAGDLGEMTRLILALSPSLAAQARYGVLDGMLEKIPQAMAKQSPWVHYWKGVCQLSLDPPQSLAHFEDARKGFASKGQPDGMYLTLVGAFNALIQARMGYDKLDPWIEKLDCLKREYPDAPSGAVRERVAADIFFVLVLRCPGHPQFRYWKGVTHALATATGSYAARLSNGWRLCFYHLWMGQYQEAFYLIDALKSQLGTNGYSDLDLIMLLAADQMASWQAGLWQRSNRAAAELENLAGQSGIPFWNNFARINTALAAITAGDGRVADDALYKLEQNIGSSDYTDKALYHFAACWRALMKDDLQLALVHGQAGIEFGDRANTFLTIAMAHFGMAMVDMRSGRQEGACVHLKKMRQQGLPIGNRLIEFMYLLMSAKMALDAGKRGGKALLRRAFKLGAQNDFVNFYFFIPAMMTGLCIKALELGIETEYVKSLIDRRGLVPEIPPLHLGNWPWRLEIYTLGRFSVLVDGAPLRSAGKAHNKPLELLKILIALGGREVGEECISEALWPDADGDMAHSAFTTTLSRLRKLLPDDVLLVSDGRLSLDDRVCRLDTWAFERLLGELDVLLVSGQADNDKVRRKMQAVLGLYHGPFLAKETPMSWMLGPRERLRLKLLRVIRRLIGFYGRTGHCQQVIALYEKALEQDPLAEEYYRGLMKCHAGRGDRVKALAVYNICRNLLNATFNMTPSEKTERLYRLIETNDRDRLSHLCDVCRRS